MLEKLKKASTKELELWMISALVSGVGLGLLASDYIKSYASIIFILGTAIHLLMMYRIYTK